LRRAESDDGSLQEAHELFERLPALVKRRLLSVFVGVNYWRETALDNVA
jgi:hypothetical protein